MAKKKIIRKKPRPALKRVVSSVEKRIAAKEARLGRKLTLTERQRMAGRISKRKISVISKRRKAAGKKGIAKGVKKRAGIIAKRAARAYGKKGWKNW